MLAGPTTVPFAVADAHTSSRPLPAALIVRGLVSFVLPGHTPVRPEAIHRPTVSTAA